MAITTIQINTELKERLDNIKVHHRESYNELIARILMNYSSCSPDKESLIDTIDVLSDPETMRDIAQAVAEIQQGDYGVPFEKVKEDLGLN